MPTKKILTPIEPGYTYHIYNRGNNYQNTFFSDEDYQLFLGRFKFYMKGSCLLYAFVLLPNHYHLLLRVHDGEPGLQFSHQYSKFILSYTNKLNFKLKRNGSFFLARFRRIRVESEDYLRRLIYYIHHNPVKHNVFDDYKNYPYSSYRIFKSNQPTSLGREQALDFFGGINDFNEYHQYLLGQDVIRKLILEED